MSCEMYSGYIMKYFDNDINDIESAQLKQHLKTCSVCSSEFEELNNIFSSLEDCSIEPPDDLEEKVMSEISSLEFQRKQKLEKGLVVFYGISNLFFAIFGISILARFREAILGFMENAGIPQSVNYAVYGILSRYYSAISEIKDMMIDIGISMADSYFVFIGIFSVFLVWVLYQTKSNAKEEERDPLDEMQNNS